MKRHMLLVTLLSVAALSYHLLPSDSQSAKLAFAADAATTEAKNAEANKAALEVVDEFMRAFNARDGKAWSSTLHFPHVRIAGGEVKVWETPEAYEADWEFKRFAEQTGWSHSKFDYRRVVQSSPDKVHVAVQFTRYRDDDSKIGSYEALYVVSKLGGRWGVQARSSFAP